MEWDEKLGGLFWLICSVGIVFGFVILMSLCVLMVWAEFDLMVCLDAMKQIIREIK